MSRYLFLYYGGTRPSSPEAGQAYQTKWMAWRDGLGAAALEPALPVKARQAIDATGPVSPDTVGAPPVSGLTIIEADTMEAALEMAGACPHITELGGMIEVCEVMEI